MDRFKALCPLKFFLIRKLKINKITPITFSDKEKTVIDFIEMKLKDLVPYKKDNSLFKKMVHNYEYSIYYLSGEGECILDCVYIDNKIIMLVKDDNFWSTLRSYFELSNEVIQYTLKYLLEKNSILK